VVLDRDLPDSLVAVTFANAGTKSLSSFTRGKTMPFHGIVATLSWPERIASYRELIGIPYLGHENDW